MPMKKKGEVVIYVRVSTPGQEEGTSLETQETECASYADSLGQEGYRAWVVREVASGANVDRLGLGKLRLAAARGEIKVLIIYTTDRLARDPVDLLVLVREFEARGVEVHFVKDPSDSTPEGDLVRFVLGFSGHRERAMIRERSVRAKDAAARAGRMPTGSRHPTYGYDYDPVSKKRVVNEQEAEVVRWAFWRCANGWSVSRIVEKLNVDEVPSKTGSDWTVKVAGDKLSNTSYIGIDFYGKTRMVGGERGKPKKVHAPREEWIEIRDFSPQLVSDRLFRQVQERLAGAQARRLSMNEYTYLMTGFAKCGKCGRPLHGANASQGNRYYRCTGTRPRSPGLQKECDARPVPGGWLDEEVWTSLVGMIRDPSRVIADLELNARTGGGDIGKEIAKLESDVARIEQEEVRLLGLYSRGTIREELLDVEAAKLSELRSDAQGRLAELVEQREREEDMVDAGERIRAYCLRVAEELENVDVDGKRALMAKLDVKAWAIKWAVKKDLMITADLDPGFVVNVPSFRCG